MCFVLKMTQYGVFMVASNPLFPLMIDLARQAVRRQKPRLMETLL